MSLAKFFDSLNPFSKKRDLDEKINLIQESLNITSAMLDELINDDVWLDKLPKLTDTLNKDIKDGSSGRFTPDKDIRGTLKRVMVELGETLNIVNEIFKNETGDVSKDGITYYRLTALNTIATISFMSTFVHRFLTVQTLDRAQAEVDWVAKHTRKFGLGLYVLTGGGKKIKTVLSNLPDRIYSKEGELLDGSVSNDTDPMQFNLLGLDWNPFYFIGVKWAQHNVNKIAALRADQKAMQFKVSMLKDRRNGVEDAALERQIRVYEEEAVDAAANIAKLERRYGISA